MNLLRQNDGMTIAEKWTEVSSDMGIHISRLAAIGTDGEYLQKQIPQKFLHAIDSAISEKFNVPLIWDGGKNTLLIILRHRACILFTRKKSLTYLNICRF